MYTTIELQKILNPNDICLQHLLQLYQYDWSEISMEGDVNETGLYDYIKLEKFWSCPGSQAFLVKTSGKIAGLVMIKKHSYIAKESPVMTIAEFFILRKYRRQKIGFRVASEIFAAFPGSWQVAQTFDNIAAHLFWNKVIAAYTNGEYREVTENSKVWEGTVQVFKSRPGKNKG